MIYFIQAGDGPVKIGYAKDIARRITNLQTAHAKSLKLIRSIEGDQKLERRFHEHFWESRLKGEWFVFSEEMLSIQIINLRERPIVAKPRKIEIDGEYVSIYKSSGNPNLVIRLPREKHAALARIAKKLKIKKSAVAREGIDREIQRHQ